MPYTLLKFLLWFGLAALIGGVIGWLLRSLKGRTELAEARAASVDDDDVDRMRHRVANLEQVVAERDRLRMQVADLRAADSPGVVGAALIPDPDDTIDDADDADTPSDDPVDIAADPEVDSAEADEALIGAEPESPDDVTTDAAPIASPAADCTDDNDGAADGDGSPADEAPEDHAGDVVVDLDIARASKVLGKKIKLDDLTVVEGIGPKISELCRGIHVDTWRKLADTDVAELRSMLDAAGPRYQIHQPDTWPQQAEFLAAGQWDSFKAFTDSLDGGR